ncbi:hypothetical protein CgunFtcFv8_020577 [Champsocephalus gunnari]|uniref:Uncharacterized protein n=1 Tax=Champsocephalus gunnari TaxID=52237 RepID=A0AAN8HZS1_CHAGU|nr:hypothetical protein CgunFtcFv8_020577 [Champsocephalus gunnari]
MRTLTPAEREQCNLIAINRMLKRSHGPAVYLHSSTEPHEGRGAGWAQFGGDFGDKSSPVDIQKHASGFLTAFSGTLGRRHVEVAGRDRRAERAGRQALIIPHRRKLK